jgi:release factor glutamine methyltransferase
MNVVYNTFTDNIVCYTGRMNIREWLNEATSKLDVAGVGTARLDSLILLEDCLGIDRAALLTEPDHELSTKNIATLNNLLNRRAKHEPLAYIRGWTEFYGRRFVVNKSVLEPRPESEAMIELLKGLQSSASGSKNGPGPSLRWDDVVYIADVGCGSGALGITAALELPNAHVELIDIDPKALKVAKTNVDLLTSGIVTIKSDLLSSTSQKYDVLLCNLPYVPDNFHINEAALHEPKIAIFGGGDGLDIYRKLFDQLKIVENKPLYLLIESLPPQHRLLEYIAEQASYQIITVDDFIQLFRLQAEPRAA